MYVYDTGHVIIDNVQFMLGLSDSALDRLQKLELERKQQELNAVIHELNKKKKEALLMAAAAQKQSSYVYQNENLCIVNKHKKPTVIAANAPSGESKPTPTSQAAKPKPVDIPQSSAPAVAPQHNPSGPPSSNATPGNPVPVQEYTAPPGQVPTVISHVPT
ncbi:uncharacterized protein LOC103514042, partial [Diaphorina citri]|uniref:Uncharacterized protein LOC103514042 n=1 Tax=Diaphorina citri TaxID=121845 RepID=A0A3Q0J848_DIACI